MSRLYIHTSIERTKIWRQAVGDRVRSSDVKLKADKCHNSSIMSDLHHKGNHREAYNLHVMVSVMPRKALKWQTEAYGHDKARVVCLCTVTSRSKEFALVCFGIRVCLGIRTSGFRVAGISLCL